jgi:hypothetical protein
MTNPPPPKSITSTPTGPRAAAPAAPRLTVGEPKGAARKGAPSTPRPDPQTSDGRWPVAWLHITAPSHRGAVPTAQSVCACGRDRMAVGHRKVLALIEAHTTHRNQCPLRNPQEGRHAA